MALVVDPVHCPACGGKLSPQLDQTGPPLVCLDCGLGVYRDPKVAVAVVVRQGDKVVLLRRAQRDAAHGRWILPGGHVDQGEVVSQAALREVREETGLEVTLEGLLGVYSYVKNPIVLIVYAARANGGQLSPSAEALEIKAFAPQDIPWDDLGYTSTQDALRDLLARGQESPS